MPPRAKVDVIVVKLIFHPIIPREYAVAAFTRQKRSPNGSLIRDWFNRTMEAEKARIPSNVHLRYARWYVAMGEDSFFTINGFRFDKIRLIFGQDAVHWVYYRNVPTPVRVEGSTDFPITFCSCCFESQYLTVMEIIKDSVVQHFNRNYLEF